MSRIVVRNTRPTDFAGIEELCRAVYPDDRPWTARHLAMHHEAFPEGQLVATDEATGEVVGMAASLIVSWDDYDRLDSYLDMTAAGTFSNHDPAGRTLYGAEVMVHPGRRRRGIGGKLYGARRELARRLGMLRIRAGARIPGYDGYADDMDAITYVVRVVRGELHDPTLSFQLEQGFDVIGVVPDYMRSDTESRGHGVLIEWMNPDVATPNDTARRDPRFRPSPRPSASSS